MNEKKQASQQPKEKALARLYRNTTRLTQRVMNKIGIYESIKPDGLADIEKFPKVDTCPGFIPVRMRLPKTNE